MSIRTSLLLIGLVAVCVYGHGWMVEPPGRASAWRYGFDTPVDLADDECDCGGVEQQYEVNGGQCGICGDPWDEVPRKHEVGGVYATGTLVRNYTQGQIITVSANISGGHMGHFEYTICPNNDVTVEATQECLDLTPLYEVGSEEFFINVESDGEQVHELQLPADLVCTQCVIQWRHVTVTVVGLCPNGTELLGCGPQEEWRGCADVAILPTGH